MSKPVPGYEEQKLTWEDATEQVTISMPIQPDVLRSLSVYTDGENVTLTWQNDSVRKRRPPPLADSPPRRDFRSDGSWRVHAEGGPRGGEPIRGHDHHIRRSAQPVGNGCDQSDDGLRRRERALVPSHVRAAFSSRHLARPSPLAPLAPDAMC